MIRFLSLSDKEYVKQAKSLWKSAFHDSDEFIDLYFEKRSSRILCLIENENVKSVLHLVPVVTNADHKTVLISGVTTDEAHRRTGCSSRLFDFLHSEYKNYNFILQPQNGDLYSFYERLGYKHLCEYYLLERKNEREYSGKKTPPSLSFSESILHGYKEQFDTVFYTDLSLSLSEAQMGEGFFAYSDDAFAFCTEQDDTCKALYVIGEFSERLFSDICSKTKCEKTEIMLCEPYDGAKPVPFNMIRTDKDVKSFGRVLSNLYY